MINLELNPKEDQTLGNSGLHDSGEVLRIFEAANENRDYSIYVQPNSELSTAPLDRNSGG